MDKTVIDFDFAGHAKTVLAQNWTMTDLANSLLDDLLPLRRQTGNDLYWRPEGLLPGIGRDLKQQMNGDT
jgi:hypothetical protein